MPGNKTLDTLAAKNPAIIANWYKDSDGYWINLKPGWQLWDCHAVHEWNVRDAVISFKGVGPCDCRDCKKATRLGVRD